MARRRRRSRRRLGKAYTHAAYAWVRHIPCTDKNVKEFQGLVRSNIVRSTCVDRSVDCVSGRMIVRANCPKEGARRSFERTMEKIGVVLRRARGA